MDEQVLATQKWLNKTYKDVSGYEPVKENGQTGWPTIYALREGLQHEVGISPVASGFGEATEQGVSKVIGKLKDGYSGNLVRLIQGAFWAKGISPSAFDGKYSKATTSAIENLQQQAGITADGKMTVQLMKALFDMSAFGLVFGGTEQVRKMQQYLNGKYHKYFGILPCDGIYQRDTNTALIYALQVEIGLAGSANGVYGPGTIAATPTLKVGASGAVVKLIQYGLMVNGYYSGTIDGQLTTAVGNQIVAFRKFMNLPPYTSTADLTVIKGLLTSNGNVNRDASAMDTSKQLTASEVTYLKSQGYNIIGRYLTGSVGVGADKRNKYLTRTELHNIVSAGMSVFPIYQDGGADISYFTANQGMEDANLAGQAARSLGIPSGATIYFAADLDVEDGNIDGTIIPYIKAVTNQLAGYKVGIYGTRNVCSRAYAAGAVASAFVADMSTGFSGNLGFPMPKVWAFDQFVEFTLGGIPIDNLGTSGRDNGIKSINNTISAKEALHKVIDNASITLDGPSVVIVNGGGLHVTAQATSTVNSADGNHSIQITNGHFDSVSVRKVLKTFGVNLSSDSFEKVLDAAISGSGIDLSADLMDGELHVLTVNSDGSELVLELIVKELKNEILDAEFGIKLNVKINMNSLSGKVKQVYNAIEKVAESVVNPDNDPALNYAVTFVTITFLVFIMILTQGKAIA